MKIIYAGLYPKNGSAVYRYQVLGTPVELADYISKQTQAVLQDGTNIPLFFAHKPLGCECELRLSRDGQQYFPQDDEMLMVTSTAKSLGASGDRFLSDFLSTRIKDMMAYLKRKPSTKVAEQPQVTEQFVEDGIEPPL